MRNAAIAQKGTPRDLYEAPADAFVADFIGEANLIAGRDHRAGRATSPTIADRRLSATACRRAGWRRVRRKLAVRPSRMRLVRGADGDGVAAVIDKATYVGSRMEYTVTAAFGTRLCRQRRRGDALPAGRCGDDLLRRLGPGADPGGSGVVGRSVARRPCHGVETPPDRRRTDQTRPPSAIARRHRPVRPARRPRSRSDDRPENPSRSCAPRHSRGCGRWRHRPATARPSRCARRRVPASTASLTSRLIPSAPVRPEKPTPIEPSRQPGLGRTADRPVVDEGAAAEACVVHLVQHRVMDHADHHPALMDAGDDHAPLRDAVDEIRGPVDRVDHPGIAAGARRSARLPRRRFHRRERPRPGACAPQVSTLRSASETKS